MTEKSKTQRLTVSSLMLALATALSLACEFIPFLNLPFGGGFTVASMLPIVVISYMYGIRWGLFVSFVYSIIQALMSVVLGKSLLLLFMPSSDDYMGIGAAIAILFIDYILAYTVIGLGGMFRKCIKRRALSLACGAAAALSLRYICHVVSGYIFYGAWAEWFFSQDGFYAIGAKILDVFSGKSLALVYSLFYNGLYMIPEIIITCVCAVFISGISFIRAKE